MIIGRYNEKKPPVKGKNLNIRVALFFDGTANNRYNVLEADRNISVGNLYDLLRLQHGSYRLQQSNVARMAELYRTGDIDGYEVKVFYVEGVATSPRQVVYKEGGFDSLLGSATGMGRWGILACAKRGYRMILRMLRDLQGRYSLRTKVTIENLRLDLFGFSRGAAAARVFCNKLQDDYGAFKGESYTVKKIQTEFMGLFDTVTAYGFSPSAFVNGIGKLPLTAKYPLLTVHFVAADEIRELFALTRIKSARAGSKEIIIPGCHSDVGGGYRNYRYEDYLHCGKSNEELVKEGWKRAIGDSGRVVRNEFALLVMSYMVKQLNAYRRRSMITVVPNIASLPPPVRNFKKILFNIEANPLYLFKYDACMCRNTIVENKNNALHLSKELSELRYGFLHLSASGRIGMRASANGKRIIIDDI